MGPPEVTGVSLGTPLSHAPAVAEAATLEHEGRGGSARHVDSTATRRVSAHVGTASRYNNERAIESPRVFRPSGRLYARPGLEAVSPTSRGSGLTGQAASLASSSVTVTAASAGTTAVDTPCVSTETCSSAKATLFNVAACHGAEQSPGRRGDEHRDGDQRRGRRAPLSAGGTHLRRHDEAARPPQEQRKVAWTWTQKLDVASENAANVYAPPPTLATGASDRPKYGAK